MPLAEPYTIAYETISKTTNIFLSIETASGLRAWGCAAPDIGVTGETAQSVTRQFSEHIEPMLHGAPAFQHARTMEAARQACPDSPSLLAMVDMALYDLLAQRAQLPLYQLLGGYRHSIPTSITIGILNVEDTLKKAAEFVGQGFFILKIKGGLDVEQDIERIHKIREQFGPSVQIRFDANQGYTVAEALDFVKKTRDCKVEILEQPTSREALGEMGEVSRKSPLPVMADESLLSLIDAFRLARYELADMINIKLMKVGGIAQAMHINSVAKSADMEVMVGCMDESALGIAAGLHFALARPNVEFADLDGHLDLLNDPTSGCFRLEKGVLYPASQAGLGWAGMHLY